MAIVYSGAPDLPIWTNEPVDPGIASTRRGRGGADPSGAACPTRGLERRRELRARRTRAEGTDRRPFASGVVVRGKAGARLRLRRRTATPALRGRGSHVRVPRVRHRRGGHRLVGVAEYPPL